MSKCEALSLPDKGVLHKGAKVTKFKKKELCLMEALCRKKDLIDAALCDNVNTPAVMSVLRELIDMCNAYITTYESLNSRPNQDVLKAVSTYVRSVMKMFGMPDEGSTPDSAAGGSISESFTACVDHFSEFRDKIRKLVKLRESHKLILQECDNVRDNVFHKFGVQLDDSDTGHALVKFVGNVAAAEARELRIKKEAEANEEKKQKREYEQKRVAEKSARAAVEPSELFKSGEYAGKFSEYDKSGVPTKGANGEPLSKSQRKKYEKAYTIHTHLHKSYLERMQ